MFAPIDWSLVSYMRCLYILDNAKSVQVKHLKEAQTFLLARQENLELVDSGYIPVFLPCYQVLLLLHIMSTTGIAQILQIT